MRAQGAGKRARCYSSRLLECESKLSVWKRPSVAAMYFPKSWWLLSGTFSNPNRSKEGSQTQFQEYNPRVCFPESFCLCCIRVHLAFWGTRLRWLLLSFSFAEAVCCIGRCDFNMQASKVGGLVHMLKNHKIKVYCSESSSETKPAFFGCCSAFPPFSKRCIKLL